MSHTKDESELIEKFENALKKNSMKQPLLLYKNINTLYDDINASAVVANVTSQLKAIQEADSARYIKGAITNLQKYKSSSFLPLNMLPQNQVLQPKCIAKFETQFVLDTQLVNLMENAEACHNNGITQEFDTTFNHLEEEKAATCSETPGSSKYNSISPETNSCNMSSKNDGIEISTKNILNNKVNEKKSFVKTSQNKTQVSEHSTVQYTNNCVEIASKVDETEHLLEDIDIPSSYIFQPIKRSDTPSPLVFDLNQFETFEKIALPIVEEETDINSAKKIINSQVLGKELSFINDCESQLLNSNIPSSPILTINSNKSKFSKTDDDEQDLHDCKNSTFLQDEILFSSDEESEYIHKELEDLPLTCALETSFYEHSEVLDKTIFVGFQTASNRSIQISRKSFTKAQCLLDDFNKDDCTKISLTELVDKCDSLSDGRRSSLFNIDSQFSTKEKNIKTINLETKPQLDECDISINTIDLETILNTKEISDTALLEDTKQSDTRENVNNKELEDDSQSDKTNIQSIFKIPLPPVKRKFDGFMTASNKKIKLSDQAIARGQNLFKDIDLENNLYAEKVKPNLNTHENAELLAIDSQQIDEDIMNEFAQDMPQLNHQREKKVDQFVGFKTASRKDIHISKEAIAKSKKLFDDMRDNEDFCNNFIESTIPTDVGFKTASNKNIKISKEALAKCKNILEDFDGPIKITNLTGKETKSSNNALSKLEYNVKDIIVDPKKYDENLQEKTPHFVGFRTANNTDIKISEEAYKKTKNLFKNISTVDADSGTIDLFLDKKKDVQTNFEMEDIHKLQSEMHIDDFYTEFDIPVIDAQEFMPEICGFKTASNKSLRISNNAIAASKKLFEDLVLNNEETLNEHLKSEGSMITRQFKGHNSKDLEPLICGFKTASNKSINISDKAIAETKNLFADLDLIDDLSYNEKYNVAALNVKSKSGNKIPNQPNKPCSGTEAVGNLEVTIKKSFPGLVTASNKEIVFEEIRDNCTKNISDLAESKNINNHKNLSSKLTPKKTNFIDIELNKNEKIFPTSSLFKTASQKPVKISEEALSKSKNLLENNNSVVENTDKHSENDKEFDSFEGFRKSNMKSIQTSARILAKRIGLFENNDDDTKRFDSVTTKEPLFKGFQTASKKPVEISESALAESKLLISGANNVENNILDSKQIKYGAFYTASDKAATVSKEALVDSKKIIGDVDFKVNRHNDESFKCFGFQTASNKKVKISEEALKKSRQILKNDLEDNILTSAETHFTSGNLEKNKENINVNINSKTISLKTDINNDMRKTEDVERSEKLVNDNFESYVSVNNRLAVPPRELNVEKLIDTQILNNFDTSLNTEDFLKETTPKHSKRSGSPILSCPKAKKRKKFETPYRSDSKAICVPKGEKTELHFKYDTTLLFTDNYKKERRYSLIDLGEVEKNETNRSVDSYFFKFTYDSLLDFEFSGKRNDLTDNCMDVKELKECFTSVVNKKLIPDGWLDNHIRLIIWKLISYEVKFPSTLSGVCSVKNVLDQLKYRYDKELYDAKRPILRKILEKDDVPSKTMVLCVAGIYVDGANVYGVTDINSNVELLLTDGWYSVKANIDKMLTKLVYDEKIKIGCKIITNGAELLNCEQGVAPWEDTAAVRLKIFGNSTRLTRWHTRLGCHSNTAIFTHLSSVQPEGGKVSKIRAYITRVYPALFVEKFDDGSTVTRSERLENIYQVKYEVEKQSAMEKLYEEVERELSDQESQDSESGVSFKQLCNNGSQYNSNHITSSQMKALEEKTNRRREKIIQNIQAKLEEKMEKYGLNVKRNVVSLLKVRVASIVEKKGTVVVTKALMSIWKPNDAIAEIIKEGIWIEVMNVVPTAVRYSEIQISAGRNSVFLQSKHRHTEKVLPFTKILNRRCYHIKELTKNSLAYTDYNEVDTVGFIFHIEPSNANFELSKEPFQNVYLADAEKNIICVNFWGGLKKFGYQNVLDTGQVFACINLQKRTGNTKKSILHYRVTEFSYFTKTPKYDAARNFVEELVKRLSGLDKRKFCEECLVLKNNFSKMYNSNNISPYRFNNDHNLTRNKLFIDSPVPQKSIEDFNLTGLDFESSFKQDTQLSPKLLLRKKKVNEKIAKLKMYGEPPPLSPIHIINESKRALSEYKSPLISNALPSVASAKNTPSNSRNEISKHIKTSPIICMNHTYVKSMNPIKLNFDVQDTSKDDLVDHFAEEFDDSPPLSLE